MEGLEATVVSALVWREDNEARRLDSEYQLKRSRTAIERVRAFGAEQFSEDRPIIIHPQEIIREYVEEGGVWFLRAQNVRPLRIDPTNRVMISTQNAAKLGRNRISRGDVLITRTGANRGQCAYFDRDELAIASSHTFIVRPQNIDPQFLAVFLNTPYGEAQITKGVYGAAQPEVAPYYLGNIWIPSVTPALVRAIKRFFAKSNAAVALAESSLRGAEATLLAALGLANWSPPEPLTYLARASDALEAGRLDAQYFRPLFAEVQERLQAAGHGVELGALASTVARGRQPTYAKSGLPVINSKHVRTNRIVLDDNRTAVESASSVLVQSGDVLVNGTGIGTIGRAAAYLHTERALPDNHVTVIRAPSLDPLYLAAFLNSPLGQWQIERHIKGSSGQIELYPDDIRRIVIWEAPAEIQASVRQSILASFVQERRAASLLDAAKRSVEVAIEEGESTALDYLEQMEDEV